MKAMEPEGAVAHAHKPQCRMADRGRHAAHLAVFAFGKRDLKPGGRNIFTKADRRCARWKFWLFLQEPRPAGLGPPIPENDPLGQEGYGLRVGKPLHLRPISPRAPEARFAETTLETPIIGENQQPLAVPIEPAAGIDSLGKAEARQGLMTAQGAKLRDDAAGLVENDRHTVTRLCCSS